METKKIDFTVVHTDLEYESDKWLTLNWTTKSAGFGQLTFKLHENGMFYCGNEAMSYGFCCRVVRHYCENHEKAQWPEFVRAYGSTEEFMSHTVPYSGAW